MSVLVLLLAATGETTTVLAAGAPRAVVPPPTSAQGKRVAFDRAEPGNPRLADHDQLPWQAATTGSGITSAELTGEPVRYYGGPVENEPRLVLIFWGAGWSSSRSLEHELEAMAEGLPGSGYQAILSQYGSLDGPISPDLIASPVIEKYYDPRQIATRVTAQAGAREGYEVIQMTGGGNDGNATYAVLPAPGTAGVERGTCAFHETSGQGWNTGPTVAVILDTEGTAECSPPSATLTHEYADSVVDPDGRDSGWARPESDYPEIAEICQSQGPGRMADGAFVARLWDDSKNACEVEDDDPGSVPIGPYAEPSKETPSLGGSSTLSIESEKLETLIYPCDLEAHYYFEYGTTASYGRRTAESVVPATWGGTPITTTLSGLQHNAPYHWRAVVRTSNGTFDGVDHRFSIPWDPEVREEEADNVQSTSAVVGGYIDPGGIETTYYIEYGASGAYGSRTEEASVGSGEEFDGASVALNDLEPGTAYHFRLVATNAHGTTFGQDSEFETHGGKPTATTLPATAIGYTRATFTGSVFGKHLSTDYYFEYGTTTSYGQRTAESEARGEERPEVNTLQVDDLAPNTVYHYRIVASNPFYGTSYGDDQTFSTAAEPIVETGAPIAVGDEGATLTGAIDPRGEEVNYYFEYGPTESYGQRTVEARVGSGSVSVEERQTVGTLDEAATYHFRIVATSGLGTIYGADHTFSTKSAPTVQTGAPRTVGPETTAPAGAFGPITAETPVHEAPGLSPSITNFRESSAIWREDDRAARFSRATAPTGTTFSFSLNQGASVRFSFVRLLYGGHHCAPQHAGPKRGRCVHRVQSGGRSFAGRVGTNQLLFGGRISRREELSPGSYEVVLTATNTTGQRSTPVPMRFTIVAR